MKANKNSFVLYLDTYEIIEKFTSNEKGLLLDCIFQYVKSGIIPEDIQREVLIAFLFIKQHLDRDAEKYIVKCKANTINGRQGGRPSLKQMVINKTERLIEKPRKADSDNENDFDSEGESDLLREFNIIWELYDRKDCNKKEAFKKFNSLSKRDIEKIKDHVPEYVKATPDVQFRKMFTTYLNKRHWESEEVLQKKDIKFGVGEFINERGQRTYGTDAIVPEDAPPRPSDNHYWHKSANEWRRS